MIFELIASDEVRGFVATRGGTIVKVVYLIFDCYYVEFGHFVTTKPV